MQIKFLNIICSLLLLFSLAGNAVEDNSTRIAKIFGEIIHLSDLEPISIYLKSYKHSYPKLSEEEIFDKVTKSKLSSIIWDRIFKKLSQDHNLEATEKEIKSFIAAMPHFNSELKGKESTSEMKEASLKIYASFVNNYKMSKHLYELYGGTVIFQQLNPLEPVGAYRKLLEEYENQGKLEIYNKKLKVAFWKYYLSEHRMIVPPNKVDFSKPWWEKSKNN